MLALRRAHAEFLSRLHGVSEAWEEPSTCEDWTVGDLVDHVIGGNVFTIEILNGETTQKAMSTAVADAPGFVEDRLGAYSESANRMLALCAGVQLNVEQFDHVAGRVSGAELIAMRTSDLTLHAWDVARSLKLDERLDGELVKTVWAAMSAQGSELAATGQFGPSRTTELSENGSLHDRLLSLTGRRP